MQFDKQTIIDMLSSRGDEAGANQAQQELPEQVDHEAHAGLLSKLGVDPQDLASKLPGGAGGLGGLLGKEI